MASVSDILGKIDAARNALEEAKTSVDGAGQETEEMITQSEGMELGATVEALEAVRTQIEELGQRVVAVTGGIDDLVTAIEAIRGTSSS
jgi:hypothetical protein